AKDALPALYTVAASEKLKDETRLAAALFALRIDRAESRKASEVLSAIPVLVRVLDGDTPKYQSWVANAAGLLGSSAREVLPALRNYLNRPPGNTYVGGPSPDFVRKQVEAAIKSIEADSQGK